MCTLQAAYPCPKQTIQTLALGSLAENLQAAQDPTHRARVMECSRVEEVELNKKDIPGAAISELFECHTIPALQWWLLCRGVKAPTAWKNNQLISRFEMPATHTMVHFHIIIGHVKYLTPMLLLLREPIHQDARIFCLRVPTHYAAISRHFDLSLSLKLHSLAVSLN